MPRRRGLSDVASTGGYKHSRKPTPKPRAYATKAPPKTYLSAAPTPMPRGPAGAPPTSAQVERYKAHEAYRRGLISKTHRDRMIKQAGIGLPYPFTQIGSALIQSPGGLYHLGKDVGLDIYDFARFHNVNRMPRTVRDIGAMGSQIGQDFLHPRARLGYLGLDLLAGGSSIASGIARTGAYGRTLGETGSRAAAARAALKRPVPPMGTLRHGDLTVSAPYLDNPLAWPIQQWYRGKTPLLNERRVGKRLAQEQHIRGEREAALPQALIAAGHKATNPQAAALDSIYVGKHPLERAAQEVKWARGAKTLLERRRHMKLSRLYRAAAHYVDEVNGKLVISDSGRGRSFRNKLLRQGVSEKHLKELYRQGLASGTRREAGLFNAGLLSERGAQFRIQGPGEVITTGQRLKPRRTDEQVAAVAAGGPEAAVIRDTTSHEADFTHQSGEMRVPSTAKRRVTFGAFRPTTGLVGHPRLEGSLTHGYSGDLLVRALERHDTPKLIAESELTSLKYRRVLDNRDRLIKASSPVKVHEDDVAVRLDHLKGKPLDQETRALLDKEEAGLLSRAGQRVLGQRWSKFVKDVFPDEVAPQKGIVWVPRRIADGIMPEAELAGKVSTAGKAFATGVDVTNTLLKMGLLTVKGPGYVLPNLAGQIFLGLAHQGVHLPGNLAELRHLYKTFSPEDWQLLKAEGGSGIARVLESRGRLDLRAQAWLVGLYESLLDTPFRTSGVLHELHRRGIKGDQAILDYLHDPSNEMLRQHVSHYAREAYINFGKLNPLERAYVTRAFFLYPWLKGSARYTIRFLIEHPAQAAVLVKLGQTQIARNKTELGNPADWFTESGSFKVGGSDAFPVTVNPQAATILGQLPQLALEAGRDPVGALFQHLSPAADIALSTGLKTSPFYGGALHGSRWNILLDQSLGQTPVYQLIHPRSGESAVYPGSRRGQAASKFGLGGMTPRVTSRAAIQAGAHTGGKKSGRWDFGGSKGSKSSRWDFGGKSSSKSSRWDFSK